MILKIFGREMLRVERNRAGVFSYEFLPSDSFHNTNNYLHLSLNNSVAMTIIALRAKMYSQMKISHKRIDGSDVPNSPYVALLKKPNYFQSQEDFLFQQMWFLSACGSNYTYQTTALGMPKMLYNLIPSDIDFDDVFKLDKFIVTDSEFKQFEKKTIKYKLHTQTHDLPLKDITPFYDLSNGLSQNDWMRSPSRLQGIQKVLSNIDENVKAKNINLQFAQKFLAINKQVQAGNSRPLQQSDRDAIADVLRKNSLQISSQDIDVKHLVSDLKRLFLDEQFANDALKCLLAFDMNKDILNYFGTGGSTFENQEKGELRYLQNSIVTSANNTMNSFSQTWGLFERGEYLQASYDHLPIMQGVMSTKIDTFKKYLEVVEKELSLNAISQTESVKMIEAFRQKLGL